MFWGHRWRNPDKAASHPEVAQWHSGSMKLRAWKTLKRDPRKKHGTTKEQMCRIKINSLQTHTLLMLYLMLILLFVAFITFSEVSNGGSHKMWRHAQPNSAMSDPIIWNLRIFGLYILALPRFSPPAPHPLRHRPHQEERKGELSELHKNSNARFGNCLLEFGKIKGKETPNVWNIQLFQSFNLPEI